MRPVPLLVPLACLFGLVATTYGQSQENAPAPLPILEGRPDSTANNAGSPAALPLGEAFRSVTLGVSLRPPAGFKTVRRVGSEEVDFVDEQRKWALKLSRVSLDDPITLEPGTDKRTNLPRAGYVEITVERLKAALPGAVVLRGDVTTLPAAEAGMIALRYVQGLETRLSQQALIRRSDRLYYVVSLTTPGSKSAGAGAAGADGAKDLADDPAERQAVETFQDVLDSVELLDQEPIRREQEDRFYETAAVLVNLSSAGRLQSALLPRQWFRILRNGKDIGYVYMVEETADGIPGHQRAATAAARSRGKGAPAALGEAGVGVLIGMRSRTLPEENLQVDSESWMFCTPDRRVEEWSTITLVQDLKSKTQDYSTTVGSSIRQSVRVLDKRARDLGEQWDKNDPGQPPVVMQDNHQLNVTHASKTGNAEPLKVQLGRTYLPQALGHLLPRVLPRNGSNKYMFATYVPEARAVMQRYLDVGAEKRVTLAGESLRAIPVEDRIGLEGSVTTHYVTRDGKYLGSENKDAGVLMLPSDEQSLLKIWKDANFTRPADVKETAPAEGAQKETAQAAKPERKAHPPGATPASPRGAPRRTSR